MRMVTLQDYLQRNVGGNSEASARQGIEKNAQEDTPEGRDCTAYLEAMAPVDEIAEKIEIVEEDFALGNIRVESGLELAQHVKDYFSRRGIEFTGYDMGGCMNFKGEERQYWVNMTFSRIHKTAFVTVQDRTEMFK